MKAFKLPDLGEGLAESVIVQWHINIGDIVTIDQIAVTVETAKATVDIPSPYSGKIIHRYGEEGDVVDIGHALFDIEEIKDSDQNKPVTKNTLNNTSEEDSDKTATVVGNISQKDHEIDVDNFSISTPDTPLNDINQDSPSTIIATPSARLLAKKLGIDINTIKGSAPDGLIIDNDIYQAYGKQNPNAEVLKGARRTMVNTMTSSHQQVASVTITEEAQLTQWQNCDDITVRLVKAISHACNLEPSLNAWFNPETMTRYIHDNVNIGIAVDSKQGLYVPVLHNALEYHGEGIRRWIDRTAASIRNRKISREQLQGATITLSNFGAIAGIYATPVVTPPQVAIVGVGRLSNKLIMQDEQVINVKTLPLSVTFDHRVCTGGEAAKFIKALVESLESSTPISQTDDK